jgi:hypothetical protein
MGPKEVTHLAEHFNAHFLVVGGSETDLRMQFFKDVVPSTRRIRTSLGSG